jgi:hypothetical protein
MTLHTTSLWLKFVASIAATLGGRSKHVVILPTNYEAREDPLQPDLHSRKTGASID